MLEVGLRFRQIVSDRPDRHGLQVREPITAGDIHRLCQQLHRTRIRPCCVCILNGMLTRYSEASFVRVSRLGIKGQCPTSESFEMSLNMVVSRKFPGGVRGNIITFT